MNLEKLIYFLLGAIMVLIFTIWFNHKVFTEQYTYDNIIFPTNTSVNICKDGEIIQGLTCDQKITCCK